MSFHILDKYIYHLLALCELAVTAALVVLVGPVGLAALVPLAVAVPVSAGLATAVPGTAVLAWSKNREEVDRPCLAISGLYEILLHLKTHLCRSDPAISNSCFFYT